jgi:hypothetical protein
MESKLLHYKPDNTFPKMLVPSDGKMKPQRITRTYLEEVIYKVHLGLKIGELKKMMPTMHYDVTDLMEILLTR